MTTTTSTLPPAVRVSLCMDMLSIPTPNFIHNITAVRKVLPANGGDTIRFRRYQRLPSATVPLGNTGQEPPPTPQTVVDIDARISYYAQYVYTNEQVFIQNQESVLAEQSITLGISLRQTEDELTRNLLAASATAFYGQNGSNGDTPTEPSLDDVNIVTQMLFTNNAYSILKGIPGANKFGTGPVRNAFIAMCSTELQAQLQIPQFINVNNYPSQQDIMASEFGSINNIRFFMSSEGSVIPNSSMMGFDIFNIFVTGMEAYAATQQDRYNTQFLYRPAIYSGPTMQNVSLGWKMSFVPAILNDQWLLAWKVTNHD